MSNDNGRSGTKSITQNDIWKTWVLPIVAALVVIAFLMVERLQVDWSADCTLKSGNACDADIFANLFAWLPAALTYAGFHIWGARHLIETPSPAKSAFKRGAGIVVYTALQLLPVPGWYLFYVGIAGGFIISLTVIGLIVAPAVGAMTAGFSAGLILAGFAGPPLKDMTGKQLKTFFWNYGLGGCFGALILAVGQVIFDPAFAHVARPQNPWLTALGALAVILAVGIVTSYFGIRAWTRAQLVQGEQNLQIKQLSAVAALAAFLILPSHLMVKNSVTVFGKDGERFPLLAGVLRGNKPAIDTPFLLAGLRYVGRREDVERREIIQRSRMESTVLNKGTASEVTVGKTVYDGLTQWRLTDKTSTLGEAIYVTADQSARMIEQECLPDVTAGDTFCVRSDGGGARQAQKNICHRRRRRWLSAV